jgi:hypothetical protein
MPVPTAFPPAKLPYGETTYNVRDYGARADGTTDSTAAIQRAIDAAGNDADADDNVGGTDASKGVGPRRTVYLPGGPKPYMVSSPLKVRSRRVGLRGDGPGLTQLKSVDGYQGDVIWFGMETSMNTTVALPDATPYRVDLHGVLDGVAAPSTGVRWGYDFQAVSGAPSFLSIASAQLAYGAGSGTTGVHFDRWGDTTQLTVSVCAYLPDNTAASPYAGLMLLGMGDSAAGAAYPWFLQLFGPYWTAGGMRLVVQLADGVQAQLFFATDSAGAVTPGVAGVYRMHVVWDAVNFRYGAAVMPPGQTAYTWQSTGLVGCPTSGSPVPMQMNDWEPMLVNSSGPKGSCSGPAGVGPFKLYGFKLDKCATFTPGTAGSAIGNRIDYVPANGGPLVNDATSFFGETWPPTGGARTIGCLPLQDPPSNNRVVTCYNGGATGAGAAGDYNSTGVGLLYTCPATRPDVLMYNSVKDMEICGGSYGGAAAVIGNTLEFEAKNLKLNSFQGVQVHPILANYTHKLEDIDFNAYDSCVTTCGSMMVCNRMKVFTTGMVAFRACGSAFTLLDSYVYGISANCRSLVKTTNLSFGAWLKVDGLLVDSEGDVPMKEGVFHITMGSGVGAFTLADFNHIVVAFTAGYPCFNLTCFKPANTITATNTTPIPVGAGQTVPITPALPGPIASGTALQFTTGPYVEGLLTLTTAANKGDTSLVGTVSGTHIQGNDVTTHPGPYTLDIDPASGMPVWWPSVGWLTARNVNEEGNDWSDLVQVNGSGWGGRVEGWGCAVQSVLNTGQYGTVTNVVVATTP